MVKKTVLTTTLLIATTLAKTPSVQLQTACLNCHTQQKIPSELIYRRYLLTYSTHQTIEEKLLTYLKDPKKENSIMPKQFFLKFPQKEPLDLNQTALTEGIQAYLDYFDIRRELKLP
jgi:hypothetical protein